VANLFPPWYHIYIQSYVALGVAFATVLPVELHEIPTLAYKFSILLQFLDCTRF
jgi:hypothetical protein